MTKARARLRRKPTEGNIQARLGASGEGNADERPPKFEGRPLPEGGPRARRRLKPGRGLETLLEG